MKQNSWRQDPAFGSRKWTERFVDSEQQESQLVAPVLDTFVPCCSLAADTVLEEQYCTDTDGHLGAVAFEAHFAWDGDYTDSTGS